MIAGLLAVSWSASLLAGPPVAPTEPLSPEEQKAKFKLPPGFEIQLVAAEPDIQKPMNLAFDAQGRLWVTHSIEYPFPAADPEMSRDGLTVLDGIGADGRATKITRFADRLNIPIGVLPLPSGREALVWSIPNLWKLTDTDGDGVADKRDVILGPFDYVDTHGNQNALRLGLDGWVYACHGFRNSSKVKLKGQGLDVLEMQSGNTYRFRPDGSAAEQLTWGQVNPFGMCFDARGDRFTADCHSKPITLMLRGGYYDSFGKPHDGLGFAPITTSNDHGSTGIAGVVVYQANQFPPEYADNIFVGNVVTNIVHRDQPQWRGSSPWIEQPEDFLTCDDWWFHPVDLQLGPDGALYVCDFYNSIIGHYEVDLKHPRRDRHRGRIWRIVYRGDQKTPAPTVPNLTTSTQGDLIERLSDANLNVRQFAAYELERRFRDTAIPQLRSRMESPSSTKAEENIRRAHELVQSLWLLWRNGQLTASQIETLARNSVAELRVHVARVLGETTDWNQGHLRVIQLLAKDSDPFVRRASVESIGRHPNAELVPLLVQIWQTTDAADQQLIHATRIAIRNQLRAKGAFEQIHNTPLRAEALAGIAEMALAVSGEAAAQFTFEYLQRPDAQEAVIQSSFAHIARNLELRRLDDVAGYVQRKYPDDLNRQLAIFQSVLNGLTQRGAKFSAETELGRWAIRLATRQLTENSRRAAIWENIPLAGAATNSPWGVRHRQSTDGNPDAMFFDSIVNGEKLTGILRSGPFTIPDRFSFWMCGHNGFPNTTPPPVNHVRLKLVETGEVVAKEIPPRDDVARQYIWDLKPWAGQQGLLEAVDADTGTAYAWLAIGRFDPPVVAQPTADFSFNDAALVTAVQVADQLRLVNLAEAVIGVLKDGRYDTATRIAAAQSSLNLAKDSAIGELSTILHNTNESITLRIQIAQLLGSVNSQTTRESLATLLRTAPAPLQQPTALALISSPEGGALLFELIATGRASARLLQDKPILDRLGTQSIPDRDQRIKDLTAGLPAADDRLKQTISRLANSFANSEATADAGAAIFKKSCSACHRISDQGGKVGPQLDGVGIRGVERLLEDVLDPNRNVDAAFRATVVEKKDGLVVTGLKLREEGTAVILGDNQGKEVRIRAEEIEELRLSNLSPMPSNFADQLNEADLKSLLVFLLSQRQNARAP